MKQHAQSICQIVSLWVGWYCMHNGGWVSTVHLLVSYIVMSPNPACLKCTLWYNYNGLTHTVIQIHVQCTSYALSCCHVSQCMSFHCTLTAVSQGSMIWGTSWKSAVTTWVYRICSACALCTSTVSSHSVATPHCRLPGLKDMNTLFNFLKQADKGRLETMVKVLPPSTYYIFASVKLR